MYGLLLGMLVYKAYREGACCVFFTGSVYNIDKVNRLGSQFVKFCSI